MATEVPIPWDSYFNLGSFAYDIAAQAFALPDPLDAFLSAFSGRPTMQATADIASNFNKWQSPVTRLLALGAARLVHDNIPISSPDAAPIFGPFYKAALILENAIRWNSQAPWATNLDNATLRNALHEAGNPGSGTPTLQAVDGAYAAYIAAGSFNSLQQIADNPPDNGSPAGQLEQGTAKKFLESRPGSGATGSTTVGSPALPPPPPPVDLEGDELLDSANILENYLYYIAYNTRLSAGPSDPLDNCCGEILVALTAISSALASLVQPPIDLTAINAGLASIVAELQAIMNAITTLSAESAARADSLVQELCKCIGAPLENIANALTFTGTLPPLPHAIDPDSYIKSLVTLKLMPDDVAQAVIGAVTVQQP